MTEDVNEDMPQINKDKEALKQHHETLSKHLLEVFNSCQGEHHSAINFAVENPLVKQTIGKLKKFKGVEKLHHKDLQALNERFMSGHLPRRKSVPVCADESDDDDDDEVEIHPKEKHDSALSKVLQIQVYFLVTARNYIVKYVSKFGQTWIRSMIPTRQIATLVSFLLYTYVLNAEVLLFFLPLFTLFVSLLAMVISTLRSVRGEKRFKEFTAWAQLLESVETALNVHEAEDNYFMNHLSPLLSLPVAVTLCIMSFAVSAQDALPTSEMALASLGLAITCFMSFYECFNLQALSAIAILVAATLLEGFSRLSDKAGLFGFCLGSIHVVQINFSLSIVLRLLSLALAVSLPFDRKHRTRFVGIIRSFVPCVYVLLWWEMFSLFFHDSSTYGLIRASVGVAAFLFSIPAAFILFFFTLANWLISLEFLQVVGSVLLFALPLLYLQLSRKGFTLVSKLNFSFLGPSVKIVAGISLVILGLSVVTLYRPSGLQVHDSSLTWNDYDNLCNLRPGVLSQRLCYQLKGHHVNWTGTVTDIRIKSIDNKFESVVNVFPSTIANWFTCTYGEQYPHVDRCISPEGNTFCGIGRKSERECHLDAYNKYEFVIVVQDTDHEKPRNIALFADNVFKECVFHIRTGMKITFRGVLDSDVGVINLNKIKILSQLIPEKCSKNMFDVTRVFENSLKAMIRFVFSPLITFTEANEED